LYCINRHKKTKLKPD